MCPSNLPPDKTKHFSFANEKFVTIVAHNGYGTISTQRVIDECDQSAFQFIDLTEIPAGHSIGLHTHGSDEEVYVIISGKGQVWLDGNSINVSAGDVILNAAWGTHSLTNTSTEPLRMVVLDAITSISARAQQRSKLHIFITGPAAHAVSGIATHVDQILSSRLHEQFILEHFIAGGEGLKENWLQRIRRQTLSPFKWFFLLLTCRSCVAYINTALNTRALCRDTVYLILGRLLRRPVVWQVHGGSAPIEFCGRSRLAFSLLRMLLSIPDRVVVISQQDELSYGSFVDPERLVRIRNAVLPHDILAKASYHDSTQPLSLIFIGRLVAEKGILDCIEAVKLIRDAGCSRVTLQVAGSGPLENVVRRMVCEYGLNDMIKLLGSVDKATRQKLLQESDLFLLPTYHAEKLPYALLEGMAAGVVPLTCAVGGIAELVIHEKHGLIIKPQRPDILAAAILRLEDDRALLTMMANASREQILQNYSIETMTHQLETLYRSLDRYVQ
jgi:glycosyltransferase involved in cell wall biosynthesis/mannose-6-phosphate isomerase-like protein (cupin superfamily)